MSVALLFVQLQVMMDQVAVLISRDVTMTELV
jgi:hypothetical protein